MVTRAVLRVTVVTTGGTIAKTYNEQDGSLRNVRPVVETIFASIRLPDLKIAFRDVLAKDSLDLTEDDRRLILASVKSAIEDADAVIVVHGTDTLEVTGEMLFRELSDVRVPVILTGAMRPFEFRDSDALQNVTESLLACRFVGPGVYAVLHNRVLRFPGVVKDRERVSFTKQ